MRTPQCSVFLDYILFNISLIAMVQLLVLSVVTVLVTVTEELSGDTDPGPGAVEVLLCVGAGLATSARVLAGTLTVVRVKDEIDLT